LNDFWHPELKRVLIEISAQYEQVIIRLDQLKQKEDITLSGLTDLQGAITAMQAEWTTFLADLTTALGNEDSDAAVEAAAQLVEAQTAAMQAADPLAPAPATPPAS